MMRELIYFFLDPYEEIFVSETIRLPMNHTLRLGRGSKLTFAENTGIVINGSLEVLGDADAQVTIGGSSESWSGLHVNGGGSETAIKHLTVSGGTGLFEGVQLRALSR